MESRELVYRGARAKAFKDSEPYQQAFRAVEQNIIEGFLSTEAHQADLREQLHARYQALVAIDSQLQNVIDDGEIAKEELDDE